MLIEGKQANIIIITMHNPALICTIMFECVCVWGHRCNAVFIFLYMCMCFELPCSASAAETQITEIFQYCILILFSLVVPTPGATTPTCSVSLFSWKRIKAAERQTETEREGEKTRLWYFATLLLHSWLSLLFFSAVSVSPVTHLFPLLLRVKTKAEHSV